MYDKLRWQCVLPVFFWPEEVHWWFICVQCVLLQYAVSDSSLFHIPLYYLQFVWVRRTLVTEYLCVFVDRWRNFVCSHFAPQFVVCGHCTRQLLSTADIRSTHSVCPCPVCINNIFFKFTINSFRSSKLFVKCFRWAVGITWQIYPDSLLYFYHQKQKTEHFNIRNCTKVIAAQLLVKLCFWLYAGSKHFEGDELLCNGRFCLSMWILPLLPVSGWMFLLELGYRSTRLVLDKGPLNICVCVCVCNSDDSQNC